MDWRRALKMVAGIPEGAKGMTSPGPRATAANPARMTRALRRLGSVAALALAAAVLSASPAGAKTVWLCKPGKADNPCRMKLDTTYYSPSGESQVRTAARPRRPKIDCFYVYPTVSEQPGPNADRTVEPAQRSIAKYQASRFAERCRVFAPMYRQLTLSAIFAQASEEELVAAARLAYGDVRDAFRDYLRNHNRGRGFVLIGHSQGTAMLTQLVRRQVDRVPAVRERLVSAILLGGNVVTRKGKRAGGSFRNVPTCARPSETRCLIAFSTYNDTPPDDTRFGRSSNGFAEVFGLPGGPGYEVACTNPASLVNKRAHLRTLLPSEPFPGLLGAGILYMYGGMPPSAPTTWLQPQDHYTGRCVTDNEARVLRIYPVAGARHLTPSPDDTWGLHLADVNIGLGNLVTLVTRQEKAYLAAQRTAR